MSGQSRTILDPKQLTNKVANAIATLGSHTATETARRTSVRILHEALILADSRASAKEMIAATVELADIMKADDASIRPGNAANSMRSYLILIGDLKRMPKRKASSPPTDPDTIPVQVPVPQISKPKRSFFDWKRSFRKRSGQDR